MNIVQIFPGKVWGGAEQYVLDLGRALQSRGHTVSYLCRDASAVTERLRSENVSFGIYRRGNVSIPPDTDIIHIHDSSFAGPVVKAAGRDADRAAVVFTRHIARASRVLPWRRGAYRRLSAMIFVSGLSETMWRSVNRWMPDEKCVVVHNSIPPATASEAAPSLRKKFGIPDTTPLLMFTGRVRRSKGCGVIIEALSRVKEQYAMVFVGAAKPTDYTSTLQAMAEKAGIASSIHFYGFTPDARSLVTQADIGLQPSIVREAFGLSQLEFMQAGKPVITTSNGAQPEYIDSGRTGIIIPENDPQALAEALGQLLRSPGKRTEIGRAAANYYAEHLSYPTFVDRIINIYNKSLDQHGNTNG